jgi:hypothetical protein
MHYTMYPAILRVEQVRERRERQTDRQTDRQRVQEREFRRCITKLQELSFFSKLNQQIFDSELNQGVALPEPG